MKTVMRAGQWAEKYPELGTGPVPVEPCISEEHFELEREGIFRRAWLCVGRVDDLPEAGDYFVCEIAICKVSVLVIRGPDGKVRGFHNVCSHRGNRLVSDECGTRRGRSIHCPYHHWVYNTKGELIRVPDEENFFGLEKGDHGLAPVHTDTWEGFIFVSLAATPPETLRNWLGEVAEQLDGCPFHEMKRAFTYRVEVDSNWKVILDGQNELYHLPMLHRRLVGKDFVVNAQGNIRYRDVRLYNYHGFYAIDFPSFRTVTPLRVALGADIHEAPAFHVPQMTGNMDQYMLFPNFVIDVIKFARSTALVTYSTWPRHPALARADPVHRPGIGLLRELSGNRELAVQEHPSLVGEPLVSQLPIAGRFQQGHVAQPVGGCLSLLLVELPPVLVGILRQHVLDVIFRALELETVAGQLLFQLEQNEAHQLPVSAARGSQRLLGERCTEFRILGIYGTQRLDRRDHAGDPAVRDLARDSVVHRFLLVALAPADHVVTEGHHGDSPQKSSELRTVGLRESIE